MAHATASQMALSKAAERSDTLLSIAWRHFRKHRPAMVGVAVLSCSFWAPV